MLTLVKKFFEKLFIGDKWNIGFVDQCIHELVQNKKLNNIVWLEEDKIDYAADPFVVKIGNKFKVLYEELNFWKGKGKIMMIDDFDFRTKRQVSGITSDSIHLSYPYLFSDNNKLFCIPETSKANEVALYKVKRRKFHRLVKQKVLLEGLPYVDSSIIEFDNKYWLFTSLSGNYNELYIFYASSLEGEYLPHALNPIPVEKHACRGAGNLFISNGCIYRPTQNPIDCYGGAIQINKILTLSPTDFETEKVFEITPDNNYNIGTHHISFCKDKIVLDGKRKSFELLMPFKKFIKFIHSNVIIIFHFHELCFFV